MTVDVVREWAISAARIADDKKGTDIVVLDVSSVLAITDYFVIASASNSRLVRTIAESVDEELHFGSGIRPLRVEGLREPSWVLLDYGDLVVHVFSDEMRTERGEAEALWLGRAAPGDLCRSCQPDRGFRAA